MFLHNSESEVYQFKDVLREEKTNNYYSKTNLTKQISYK